MSKNKEFIREYLLNEDYYEGVLHKINKKLFDDGIENIKQTQVYLSNSNYFEGTDVWLHPLQKIYIINDTTSSYDNGAFEFDYQFMFKYKGKYYHFISCGGN